MKFFDIMLDYWQKAVSFLKPYFSALKNFFSGAGRVINGITSVIIKLRKIIAAVPVAAAAVYLALYNETHLPGIVGLNVQEDGSFGFQILREVAVFAPLLITGVCILLMFCSRRILTPWVVSLVSLLIPLAILVTNLFPV